MGGGTDTMRMSVSALLSAERDLDVVEVVQPSPPVGAPLLPLRNDRPWGMELLCRAAAAVAGPEWSRRGAVVKRSLAKRPPRPKIKKGVKGKGRKVEKVDKKTERKGEKRGDKRLTRRAEKGAKGAKMEPLEVERIQVVEVMAVVAQDDVQRNADGKAEVVMGVVGHGSEGGRVGTVGSADGQFVGSTQSWSAGHIG